MLHSKKKEHQQSDKYKRDAFSNQAMDISEL